MLRATASLALLLGGTALPVVAATPAQAAICGTSAGYTVCLSVPDGPLTGEAVVSATVSKTNGVRQLDFTWNGAPLGTRFASPYSLIWPTDRYPDGSGTVGVSVLTTAGQAGAAVTAPTSLANGTTTGRRNPADWAALFRPDTVVGDPVLAAVGDGGSGEAKPAAVISEVTSIPSTALIYLGDVDENGTFAEFRTNYGLASFDDPAHTGTLWGTLAGKTLPVFGNHEGHLPAPYQDYWHQLPFYYSYDVGGVHVIVLDSECNVQAGIGGCGTNSPMYQWAERDLAANTLPCVVAAWHRPVVGVTQQAPWMSALWSLIAARGGDLVLNSHDHAVEAWQPMNGQLVAGAPDSHLTQLVSGAGGHFMISITGSDPRMAFEINKQPAVAYLTAVGGGTGVASRLDWVFRGTDGAPLRLRDGSDARGDVACGSQPDTTPPTAPGTPAATSTAPGSVDLALAAASDPDNATLTYRIFRDGDATPIASLDSAAPTVTYTDTGLSPGSQHWYAVTASDGVNTGPPSPPSNTVTVAGPPTIFSDGFDAGLSGWPIAVHATLSSTTYATASPSVRLDATAGQAYLQRSLGGTYASLCLSSAVDVVSMPGSTVLLKVRTATGGPIARLYVSAGRIYARDDYTGQALWTGVRLPAGWNTLALCTTPDSVSISLNGSPIGSWNVSTGAVGAGVVRVGDDGTTTASWYVDDVTATYPAAVMAHRQG